MKPWTVSPLITHFAPSPLGWIIATSATSSRVTPVTTSRIWARQAPFDLKGVLKARGYRWNREGSPNPKGWYIDVDRDEREAELAFLQTEIYQREVEPLVHAITPYNRFSNRIAARS
jgi:hypothetical protein